MQYVRAAESFLAERSGLLMYIQFTRQIALTDRRGVTHIIPKMGVAAVGETSPPDGVPDLDPDPLIFQYVSDGTAVSITEFDALKQVGGAFPDEAAPPEGLPPGFERLASALHDEGRRVVVRIRSFTERLDTHIHSCPENERAAAILPSDLQPVYDLWSSDGSEVAQAFEIEYERLRGEGVTHEVAISVALYVTRTPFIPLPPPKKDGDL